MSDPTRGPVPAPYPAAAAVARQPAPVRPVLVATVSIAAAVVLLGVPFGLLWSVLAPDVPLRMTEAGPVYAEPQPQQPAGADAWFVLLGLPFGVLLAVAVWVAAGRWRGLPALGALVAGAVGAALLGWWLGRQVGLAGYEEALAAAGPGAWLDRPPDLHMVTAGWWPPVVTGVLLVPALAAAVTYTLLAAWSRFSTLRPDDPREHPGYPPEWEPR